MDLCNIERLKSEKKLSLDIHAGIKLRIKDSSFKAGTVRVMLPVPINAPFLSEGQLLDFNPMFRMVSVEDYPQRTAYFNEILSENSEFYIEFAFTNSFEYVCPDLSLIDGTVQKGFSKDQLSGYYSNHHCGCESYTALARDAVSIMDVAYEDCIVFNREKYLWLTSMGIMRESSDNEFELSSEYFGRNGSIAFYIYKNMKNYEEALNTAPSSHDIASDYVSLCRMCGVPARWMGGFEVDTEMNKAHPHSWAIINLAPYGWIYVDPQNGMNPDFSDFFFGNICPSVIPTASRFGGNMYPAKDYDRADSLYNVSGEVELVPGKLDHDGSEELKGYGLKSDEFDTEIIVINA